MSLPARTDQKFLSLDCSIRCRLKLGCAGFSCRSKAVVLTAFCSSPVSRARLSVNVSAIRRSIFCSAVHVQYEENEPNKRDELALVKNIRVFPWYEAIKNFEQFLPSLKKR